MKVFDQRVRKQRGVRSTLHRRHESCSLQPFPRRITTAVRAYLMDFELFEYGLISGGGDDKKFALRSLSSDWGRGFEERLEGLEDEVGEPRADGNVVNQPLHVI